MKYLVLLSFFVASMPCVATVTNVGSEETSVVLSNEMDQLFANEDDALDQVTIDDCGHSSLKDSLGEKPSAIQAYYQSLLLYILSSYLTAKKFIFAHLPLAQAAPSTTN